jgi:hypothetical protein
VLGMAPLQVALTEGRHELVFRRGEDARYRYLSMRRGETRVVQVP